MINIHTQKIHIISSTLLSIILLITFFSIFTITVFSADCQKSFGVFYDELHSFNMIAPTGWCITKEDQKYTLKRQSRFSDTNEAQISVWFTYLSKDNKNYTTLIQDELNTLTWKGSSISLKSLNTKDGREVRIFSAINPAHNSYNRIGFFLQEDICFIRFLITANNEMALMKAEPDFRALIESYSSDI